MDPSEINTGMAGRIESQLRGQLEPEHLAILNESNKHNVPPGSESHWNIVIVSAQFRGTTLVARHRY